MKVKEVSAFIIYGTILQIGLQHFWLWIYLELVYRSVLGIVITEERNIFVADERFI
jgi:putative transposase